MLALFCSLIALAPHAPAPATAAWSGPQTTLTSTAQVDTRVDSALANAQRKLLAGDTDRVVYTELVAATRAAYADLITDRPNADTVRARLVAAIDDLYTRAAKAAIKQRELEDLRIASIEARLASAIRAAMMTDPTIEHLRAIIAQLNSLADAAKAQDPEVLNLRTRVQAAVDALIKKARFSAADLDPIRLDVSGAGAVRWMTILETAAVDGTASITDWNRTRAAISDHYILLLPSDPIISDTLMNLLIAIDALEQRFASALASGAKLTRADFDAVRSSLVARVRKGTAPN